MMSGDTRLALTGDTIALTQLSRRPEGAFHEIVDQLRDVDFSLTNLETGVHDFQGYPAPGKDIHLCAPPTVLEEIKWMGFDAVSVANNHVGDFSRDGIIATIENLEAHDLPFAGVGRNLSDARAPTYVETSAGRVAVVAASTTFGASDVAGPTGTDLAGRPGISPLGYRVEYTATQETRELLEQLSERIGFEDVKAANERAGMPPIDDDDVFHLLNVDSSPIRFERSDDDGFRRTLAPDDRDAVLERLREANRQAEWVICSIHSHEGPKGSFAEQSVPPAMEEFARDCIDNGADLFAGHGPHVLRGIELYEGCPIFYSLGDFIVQELLLERMAAEVYDRHGVGRDGTTADVFDAIEHQYLATRGFWETVVPICRYDGEDLDRIELHPLELGYDRSRAQRGVPAPADGDTKQRILTEFADLCDEYNVDVAIDGTTGVVDV